jgi:hypothetical protein
MANMNPATNKDEGMLAGGTHSATDKFRDTAEHMGQRAKEAAGQMADRAKEAASSATQSAKDMAADAQRKADSALSSVGDRLQSAAGTIREKGPHEGFLGTASSRLASNLEDSGRYLQEEGLRGMAEDVTDCIRRNPVASMFVGIGLGFLLARAIRR